MFRRISMSPLSNDEQNGSPLRRPWEDEDDNDIEVVLLRDDEPRRRLIFDLSNGTGSDTPNSSSSLQPFVTISSETEGEFLERRSRREEEEREERRSGGARSG